MALFDKMKNMVESTSQKVTSAVNQAKEAYDHEMQVKAQKKAEEEAHKMLMKENADKYAQSIIDQINENYSEDTLGLFRNKTKEEVFSYSRNYFTKLLLPAHSKSSSFISMYPQIPQKMYQKFESLFGCLESYDSCLMYFSDKNKKEFLITYDNLYFRIPYEEDNSIFSIGSIPTDKISTFNINNKESESDYFFYCDDVKIAQISSQLCSSSDLVTFNSFFGNIKNSNYEITNQDIDKVIKSKIDSITLSEINNEINDGELILFFTWNSSGGYVVCTDERIILADKRSGGNVSNINAYYYDEITRIETIQENSNLSSAATGTSLTGFLVDYAVSSVIDSALDAFTKDICELKLIAPGSFKSIPGMVKLEADRIIAVYNEFKKEIRSNEKRYKEQSAAPQQVSVQPDILEQIKKLSELKDLGILSEEEFTAKKADLLAKL